MAQAPHALLVGKKIELIGTGTLANHAMIPQENGAIFTFDDDSEADSSSQIYRFAGAIEPGKVFIHAAWSTWRR